MAEIVLQSTIKKTQPIPINKYNYSIQFAPKTKYLYELVIGFKDNKKIIRKITDTKSVEIISLDDKIKFKKIKNYELSITVIPDRINSTYEISGIIEKDYQFHNNNNKNIYVEFTKFDCGYTKCSCKFLDRDRIGIDLASSPANTLI